MLKELIQRLLDSRTTPAQAAHSAMPKPENPTIISEVIADKEWHSLIAPFDGYFSAKAITNHLLIENSSSQWQGVTALTNAGYMGFTLSMTKGSEVRYQLDPISTGVILSFSRAIGGGYNYLVKEVRLCLRTFCNYCLKLLSRVKKSGLLTNLLRSKDTKLRLLKIVLVNTPRLMTVFSLLVPRLLICREKLQRLHLLLTTLSKKLCHLSLCQKVKYADTGTGEQNSQDSSKRLDLHNVMGGLPC